MPEKKPLLLPGRTGQRLTARTLLTVVFRQRRVMAVAFGVVFIPTLLAGIFLPSEYVAETKIVVERQRFDPVITSGFRREDAMEATLGKFDEQDIDSEIDLLQSNDVLRQAVIDLDLWSRVPKWRSMIPISLPSREARIARAVRSLRKSLVVDPPNKSNVVNVRLYSSDPQQAARILQAITSAYMAKHLQIHRPAGSSEFFNQEVERNHRALQEADAKLLDFTKQSGVVAADVEGGAALEKMAPVRRLAAVYGRANLRYPAAHRESRIPARQSLAAHHHQG